MIQTHFSIGDVVYLARYGYKEKTVTCPHCKGSKALTVIFGDGEKATVDCGLCNLGYEPPRGYLTEGEYGASVESIVIDGVEQSRHGQELEVRYKYNQTGGCCNICESGDVFTTKENALKRGEQLSEKAANEEKERMEHNKEQAQRSWAWNASYHRKQIKEAKRQLEYHTAKLNVAIVKAKEITPCATK